MVSFKGPIINVSSSPCKASKYQMNALSTSKPLEVTNRVNKRTVSSSNQHPLPTRTRTHIKKKILETQKYKRKKYVHEIKTDEIAIATNNYSIN